MVTYCNKTDYRDREEGDDDNPRKAHSEGEECPIDESSGHTCDGIDLLMEDDGHVIEQYVTYHSTCHTRDTAHDDSHPEGMTECKCLLNTCYGEECQAQCVEHKPGIAESFYPLSGQNNEQKRQCSTENIHDIRHPERAYTQHTVTDCTATYGDSKATDVASKPVEMLLCSMSDT